MSCKEEFINTYNKVFNAEGNIKSCGREYCKQLIELAIQIGDKDKHYGEVRTGFMDTDNIKELYNSLK